MLVHISQSPETAISVICVSVCVRLHRVPGYGLQLFCC